MQQYLNVKIGDESQAKMSIRERFHSLLVVAHLKKRSMKPQDAALQEFESKLAEKLDALKAEGDEVGFMSIEWLQEALWVVFTTLVHLQALTPNDLIYSRDEKWVDEYMDDSTELLGICKVLKARIADMKECQKLVQVAIRNLQIWKNDASYCRARKALMDAITKMDRQLELERCSSMLWIMGEKLVRPKAASGFLPVAIFGAKVTTIFLCGLVVNALACKTGCPLINFHGVSSQCLWASFLRSLQQRIKHSIPGELHTIDLQVRRLNCIVDKKLELSIPDTLEMAEELRSVVASLAASVKTLKRDLDFLQDHVHELSRLLMATQIELYDNLMRSKKYQFINARNSLSI